MLKDLIKTLVVSIFIMAPLGMGCDEKDQSSSQTNASVGQPATQMAPTPLGVYRGAFRIKLGTNHPKMMNRDGLLASHPDPTKLFWAVSGPSMPSVDGCAMETKSYVGVFELPDLSQLNPHHTLDQTPQASAVESWVELSQDYREHAGSDTKPNYVRIGGMAFNRHDQRLYINWARYYHVQPKAVPSLAAYDATTLRRVSDFHTPIRTSGNASDPNGRITSLAQGPLKDTGDFLCTPFWGDKMHGPRQNLLRVTGRKSVSLTPLLRFDANDPWKHTSSKIQCGSGVFTRGAFVFPMRNGVAGWYGYNDGYFDKDATQFVADGDSLVPDLWGTKSNKSYHAPPYRAFLASIPVSQLNAILLGERVPQEAKLTLHDFTEQQFQYRVDQQGQKQYQSLVACSIVKQGKHFFVLGEREDDSISKHNPGPVVYVYSHTTEADLPGKR